MKQLSFSRAGQRLRWGSASILALAVMLLAALWPRPWSGAVLLAGEWSLLAVLAAWAWAGSGFFGGRRERPLGILFLIVVLDFLLLAFFLAWRWSGVRPGSLDAPAFALRLAAGAWLLMLAAVLGAVFSGLRELSLLKRARPPGWLFRAMTACFAAGFLVPTVAPSLVPFVFALCVWLLALNSFQVKWIAFLVKREKKRLILLAALALALFIITVIMIFGSGPRVAGGLLSSLSPGLSILGKAILLYGACFSGVILFATLFHLPTADAYDRKAEEFASLADLSQSITGAMEFKDLAEKVTSATAAICRSDFSWLMIIGQDGDVTVPAATNVSGREARALSLALLEDGAPDRRAVTVFRDRKLRIQAQNDVMHYTFGLLAFAPLRVKGRTTGYLFMASRKDTLFEDEDIQTVEAFANSAALALENARLLETRLEKERLLKELEVARVMQKRLLPQSLPRAEWADIAVHFSPAYEVGGDYYDFFPLEDGRLGFVIADVSGKGLAAAFIMAELKGIFESLASIVSAPRPLLIQANDLLKKSLEKSRFVSATYGLIDGRRRLLRVARAGHMPFFLDSGGRIESRVPPGVVLGAAAGPLFGAKLQEEEAALQPGDTIVFFTDGISEAKNLLGQDFGYERMQGVMQSFRGAAARELANALIEEVKAFANQPVQYDDMTLLVIRLK